MKKQIDYNGPASSVARQVFLRCGFNSDVLTVSQLDAMTLCMEEAHTAWSSPLQATLPLETQPVVPPAPVQEPLRNRIRAIQETQPEPDPAPTPEPELEDASIPEPELEPTPIALQPEATPAATAPVVQQASSSLPAAAKPSLPAEVEAHWKYSRLFPMEAWNVRHQADDVVYIIRADTCEVTYRQDGEHTMPMRDFLAKYTCLSEHKSIFKDILGASVYIGIYIHKDEKSYRCVGFEEEGIYVKNKEGTLYIPQEEIKQYRIARSPDRQAKAIVAATEETPITLSEAPEVKADVVPAPASAPETCAAPPNDKYVSINIVVPDSESDNGEMRNQINIPRTLLRAIPQMDDVAKGNNKMLLPYARWTNNKTKDIVELVTISHAKVSFKNLSSMPVKSAQSTLSEFVKSHTVQKCPSTGPVDKGNTSVYLGDIVYTKDSIYYCSEITGHSVILANEFVPITATYTQMAQEYTKCYGTSESVANISPSARTGRIKDSDLCTGMTVHLAARPSGLVKIISITGDRVYFQWIISGTSASLSREHFVKNAFFPHESELPKV